MQDRILKALIFIAFAAGFLVYSTFFIVKETQQAIVLQLGEPKKVYKDAGLYWKIPLLQNVQIKLLYLLYARVKAVYELLPQQFYLKVLA